LMHFPPSISSEPKLLKRMIFLKNCILNVQGQGQVFDDSISSETATYRNGQEFKLTAAYSTLVGYQNFMGVGY